MTLRIGNLELGEAPRIAVPIDDTDSPERVGQAAARGLDLLELRVDRFSRLDKDSVLSVVRRYTEYPTLATIRSDREGGTSNLSDSDRRSLFEAILPEIDAVDIEISSSSIRQEVVARAKSEGKTVIGSFHDFDSTPPLPALRETVEEGARLGVDVVKLATRCDSREEMNRLAKLLLEEDRPLIVVGMGAQGALSRIVFPALGSRLTYSYLDTPIAPGQLSLEETVRLIGLFYEN